MHKLSRPFILMCALLGMGCGGSSGNIWEDNQTGARYKLEGTTKANIPVPYRTNISMDELVSLDEDDLQMHYVESFLGMENENILGSKGLPRADEFKEPKGDLSAIFSPVFFETDQHAIGGQNHLDTVQRIAAYLKTHPDTYVIVEGHCDERGPEAYNLALGTRRANAVRDLLIKQGIKEDRVHAISFGKEHPFVLGHTEESWAQNRRTHFRVCSR